MQIPRSVLDALTESLNMLSGATKTLITQRLSTIEYTSMADLRNQVIEMLEPILSAATDAAASYSANTYDAIRELSTGEMIGAQAVSGRVPEATQVAVRGMVPTAFDKSFDAFMTKVLDRADYEIKRAAADCTVYNARNDPLHPKYARVPTGAETCNFCIMLASRGFVYHTEAAAGAVDHYHANCDCRVIPGFEGDTVEGYDPDEYYRQWKESGFNPNKSSKNRNKTSSSTAMMRKKPTELEARRANIKPAPQGLVNSIKNKIERDGGQVHIGDEAAEWYLDKRECDGLTIGDVVYLRSNPSKSEVLEEDYHYWQEKRGDYIEHETGVLQTLREIDAQEYLLSMTERYNIPESEVEQTRSNLEMWRKRLDEYRSSGHYEGE